jgi:hypothetical protein
MSGHAFFVIVWFTKFQMIAIHVVFIRTLDAMKQLKGWFGEGS